MAKYVKTEEGYQEVEAVNSNKMDANNPVGTGSFSMGRQSGSIIGVSSHAEGYNTTASGDQSHAEGKNTTARGNCSHAEGFGTTASGGNSHAEGGNTTASGGQSHAEGYGTTASGSCCHAEGINTTAGSEYSHAEGFGTTASASQSHAEGNNTTASGSNSHAEGSWTTASGSCSHAEGSGTVVNGSDSHAEGRYNVKDLQGKYVHIVGNGVSDNNRSNAHTLSWNGVPWFQGRPQFGGTAQDQGSQTVVANGDKEIILTSSTANSTKKFKITVDDSGTLTATEITT